MISKDINRLILLYVWIARNIMLHSIILLSMLTQTKVLFNTVEPTPREVHVGLQLKTVVIIVIITNLTGSVSYFIQYILLLSIFSK